MKPFLALLFLGAALFSSFAEAQTTDRIAAIVVEGNQRIEAETVRSYMAVSAGERFDAERIDRSLKALFNTGLFADVVISRTGDVLTVKVVENPIINRIAFEGNRALDDETLEAEVQLRPRIVYTRTRVQNDVQRILQLYRRSGRFAASVEPKVIQLSQNRVDLVFEVKEGPLTGIRRIRFIGNKAFSDSRLQRQIMTKETRWYRFLTSDDNYDPDRLTFDRELLRRYYLSRGYADFRVVSAVAELTPDRDAFFITFTLDEGEVYNFGKIEIDSQVPDLDLENLRTFLTTQEGETYDADAIEKSVEALTFELGRLGYAFVDIRPKIDRDREKKIIGVTYAITEGPRVYVERLNITGNVRTLDAVIRREFRLAEGDAFNTALLRRSRQRIRGLGFFDKVDVSQERGTAADRTVLNVDVQERSTGELSFGAGYSTAEAVVGDVSIRERNLLGRGQDLRLSLSVSGKRQQVDLGFTEPYFMDRDLAAGFDLFNTVSDLQSQSSYDKASTGGVLRTNFRIIEDLSVKVSYTLREDTIENVGTSASPLIKAQEGTSVTSAVGYNLAYDQRDDSLEATKGYILRFGQSLAGLGGDVQNLRTSLGYTHYFPILTDVVGSLSLDQGYIVGIGQDVAINNRFFLGGDKFRGFASGGLGPRDTATDDSLGGNFYYVGTAELRFPLGLPNEFGMVGRTFMIAGSLTDVDDSSTDLVDSGGIRASAGIGVSWRSPFGPISVDWAYPFMKESEDEVERFRFSFGTRF